MKNWQEKNKENRKVTNKRKKSLEIFWRPDEEPRVNLRLRTPNEQWWNEQDWSNEERKNKERDG